MLRKKSTNGMVLPLFFASGIYSFSIFSGWIFSVKFNAFVWILYWKMIDWKLWRLLQQTRRLWSKRVPDAELYWRNVQEMRWKLNRPMGFSGSKDSKLWNSVLVSLASHRNTRKIYVHFCPFFNQTQINLRRYISLEKNCLKNLFEY